MIIEHLLIPAEKNNIQFLMIVMGVNNYLNGIRKPVAPVSLPVEKNVPKVVPQQVYHCDGRVYCSQMTSCEEAKYFLSHCPGVKMDGNNDGVPCEKQWCK
jgi:hypothetical protein